jgi:hypothetical protein
MIGDPMKKKRKNRKLVYRAGGESIPFEIGKRLPEKLPEGMNADDFVALADEAIRRRKRIGLGP